jgi:hypothetical protein
MLNQIQERQMHLVRWILAIGWSILILSLFYDPISARLTDLDTAFALFHDPENCVLVQGHCLVAQWPYPIGTRLFWGMIIPSAIFFLLTFGHEAWRRICPLYFFSQLPRALEHRYRSEAHGIQEIKGSSKQESDITQRS